MLWNWYLANVFHAELSYWQSFGILLFVRLFQHGEPDKYATELRSQKTIAMLESVVTPGRLYTIKQSFKPEEESWAMVLSQASPSIGTFLTNTVILILGWSVRTFLL
jgi:hypothetical protein